MANEGQVKQVIADINALLPSILSLKAEDFERSPELGTDLNFAPAVPYIRRLFALFTGIRSQDLTEIGYPTLDQIRATGRNLVEILNLIKSFKASSPNAWNERQNLINRVQDCFDNCYQQLATTVAYAALTKGDLAQSEAEARRGLAELAGLKQDAVERLKEIEGMRDAASRAVGATGVAEHARLFGQQAHIHNVAARCWLGAAAGISVAAGLFGWWAFPTSEDTLSSATSVAHYIHYVVPRVIVLSLGFYGVFLSVKNYVAHSHNAVINRHRENSLQTFEAFVNGTKDQATKDAVLIQATRCIFEPQPTGYSPSEVQPPIPSAMVQILREAAEKK